MKEQMIEGRMKISVDARKAKTHAQKVQDIRGKVRQKLHTNDDCVAAWSWVSVHTVSSGEHPVVFDQRTATNMAAIDPQ